MRNSKTFTNKNRICHLHKYLMQLQFWICKLAFSTFEVLLRVLDSAVSTSVPRSIKSSRTLDLFQIPLRNQIKQTPQHGLHSNLEQSCCYKVSVDLAYFCFHLSSFSQISTRLLESLKYDAELRSLSTSVWSFSTFEKGFLQLFYIRLIKGKRAREKSASLPWIALSTGDHSTLYRTCSTWNKSFCSWRDSPTFTETLHKTFFVVDGVISKNSFLFFHFVNCPKNFKRLLHRLWRLSLCKEHFPVLFTPTFTPRLPTSSQLFPMRENHINREFFNIPWQTYKGTVQHRMLTVSLA